MKGVFSKEFFNDYVLGYKYLKNMGDISFMNIFGPQTLCAEIYKII